LHHAQPDVDAARRLQQRHSDRADVSFVTIEVEQIHEARINPTDGRPHLDPRVTTLTGDPRGRWDGDTPVVDSTITTTAAGSQRTPVQAGSWHAEQHRAVYRRRFTMIDQNTVNTR
jgi:hypothetical protein